VSVLEIDSLKKSFGSVPIFDGVSLSVAENDRIGLVGRNGSGKSTLLRIIAGLDDYDSGRVALTSGCEARYLAQGKEYTSGNSLYDEMKRAFAKTFQVGKEMRDLERKMSDPEVIASERKLDMVMRRYSRLSTDYELLGGYDYDVRIKSTLFGLGFAEDDLDRVIDTLSGGQKVRVALARMLVAAPNLLLLDEPTNHLDVYACEWLEDYLKAFKGAFIVVSHDRYFLDATVDRIWDIDDLKVVLYPGNYTFFTAEKQLAKERQAEEYQRQQEKIQKLEAYIRRYKAGNRSTMAKSREKMLARIERVQKPREGPSMKLSFGKAARSGRLALSVSGISKSYGEQTLFGEMDFVVERGERLGIVGPNGSGKTTFLRIVANDIPPDSGSVDFGENVTCGIFWQDLAGLDDELTVLDELYHARDWTLGEARSFAARFLFRGEDVFKPVKALSGGERNRLILAKLILKGPNLLLLDEPTNHLDIEARHALEQAIDEFEGTVICASHDRYFLDQTATSTLEIADGQWKLYDGNYSYYREQLAKERAESSRAAAEDAEKELKARLKASGVSLARIKPVGRGRPGRAGASDGTGAGQARVVAEAIEAEIEAKEMRLGKVEEELASEELYSDGERARDVVLIHRQLMDEIEALYEAWERALKEVEVTGGCED
jgi:ATP-binding cassette subfamily F protein 3